MKIADFPETEFDPIECIPGIIANVHQAMPFKRHILPSGALNMVSAIHWYMSMPDVTAKFFAGDGTLVEENMTNLHTDLANAANLCVHAEPLSDKQAEDTAEFLQAVFPNISAQQLKTERVAALWFIFWPQHYEGLRDYLKKKLRIDDDPIQKRMYQVTRDDLQELEVRLKEVSLPFGFSLNLNRHLLIGVDFFICYMSKSCTYCLSFCFLWMTACLYHSSHVLNGKNVQMQITEDTESGYYLLRKVLRFYESKNNAPCVHPLRCSTYSFRNTNIIYCLAEVGDKAASVPAAPWGRRDRVS